jgi:hypothetical protein
MSARAQGSTKYCKALTLWDENYVETNIVVT